LDLEDESYKKMIYLDFAATTKPNNEVLKVFNEINIKFWANPDSLHDFGIKAEAVLEHSRKNILENFNAKDEYKLIFTSSATESNNTIIKSVANTCQNRGKHILTTNIEHPSVMEVMFFLQKTGFNVEFLPVNDKGMVTVEQVKKAVKNETILICIMHVNNEIGSINEILKISDAVKSINKTAIFHSDCSQSVGKLPVNLQNSSIDFISFSGHKIECVKGIGAIIFRKNLSVMPLLHGGNQEFGFRGGTGNPAMAATLTKAVKIAEKNRLQNFEKVQNLQKILLNELQKIPQIHINSSKNNSPFIVNFSVPKFKSEIILRALSSEKEIYISTISACSSKKIKESYVIKAITNDENLAKSSLRASLSAELSENDVLIFAEELKNIMKNYN
jgi:cysteine desulfurase